jgi:uncharacterized protein YjiS (DUF1127 family)
MFFLRQFFYSDFSNFKVYIMSVYSTNYTKTGHVSFSTVFASVKQMWAVRKQRKELAQMDSDRLSDIGVSFEQAQKEAARPMWDCPSYWT